MDLYNLVVAAKLSKGGGDEPVLVDKTITSNGTYNASSDNADGYKTVVANVPSVTPTGNINITSTAQTNVSAYATAQVVDADLVASNIKKDVDILGVVGTYEGGGGGSSYTLLHEEDIQVTYSSTSATAAVQIPLSAEDVYTNDHIVYVRIRDKAGKRTGYWYGSDNYAFPKGHSYYDYYYYLNSSGGFMASSGKDPGGYGNGLYLREIKTSGYVRIDKKYSNGTIDGTYHIEVYALDWPGGVSPFN